MRATKVLLLAVFCFEVYRALTQGITIDEARLYLDYIRPDPSPIFHQYDAGHHILQTYLSWIFAHRFGWSEFVLRLPSVLACAAYLAFCYRFTRRIFEGSGALMFAGAALLAANPLILDSLVMARGYGLALALFAWSLLLGIESTERRTLAASGILLALSVAANLIFAAPAAGLAIAVCTLQRRRNGLGLYHLVRQYLGPAFVCGALLMMLPLTNLRLDYFYTGAAGVAEALVGTLGLTFARTVSLGIGLIAGYSACAAAAAVIVAVLALRRFSAEFAVTAATLAVTLAVLACSHLRGFPYPTARTAIALLFLVEATALAALASLPARRYLALPLIACAAFLLLQNDPRAFGEWRFDARTKQVMRMIEQRETGRPGVFSVSAHNDYAWTLNYYRLRFKMKNLEEVKTGGPYAGADYYLLHRAASQAVQEMNLKVIYQDDLCACLLAVREGTPTP